MIRPIINAYFEFQDDQIRKAIEDYLGYIPIYEEGIERFHWIIYHHENKKQLVCGNDVLLTLPITPDILAK